MEDVFVLNSLNKEVSTQAFGNWFTFKPGQMKRMRREIGDFLIRERRGLGLVFVSERLYEDKEYASSEEGKAELEQCTQAGINNRIAQLNSQVNNLKSLQRDLEQKNIKADPLSYATEGDLSAMEELHAFQVRSNDADKKRLERVKKLEQQLKAGNPALAYTKPRPATEKEEE